MSLEETLKENSALLAKNNELLAQVIGMAPASGGTASAAANNAEASNNNDAEEAQARAEYEELFGKKAGRMKLENIQAAIEEHKAKGDGGGDAGDHISFSDLKAALAAWLGEFSKAEDKDNPDGTHPEVTARREALKTVLTSEKVLANGAGKLTDLDCDDMGEKRDIVKNWLEAKAKKIDRGFGVGRLVADPEPAGDGEDDDGLGI